MYQFEFKFFDNLKQFSANLQSQFDKIESMTKNTQKDIATIGQPVQSLQSGFAGLGKMVAGAFAVNEIVGFGKSVVDTLSQFERYEAVLTNTLGSGSAAKAALADVKKFAAETPFQVDEVTDSFIKLANRGFTPNMDQMTSMGDIAASTGKEVGQFTEALLDAQMGEFERLKEFGISASKSGGNVSLAWKGMTKTVANTPAAINEAMLAFGKMDGVKGTMASISKTTGGMLSNLEDQWTQLKLTIGEMFKPLTDYAIPAVMSGINYLNKLFQDNAGSIGEFFAPINSVYNMMVRQWERLSEMFVRNQGPLKKIGDALLWVGEAALAIFVPIADLLNTIVTLYLEAFIQGLADVITEVQNMYNWFGQLWDSFSSFFGVIFQKIFDIFPMFKIAFQQTKDWLYNSFIKPIADWFGTLFHFNNFGVAGNTSAEEDAYRSGEPITGGKKTGAKKPGDLGLASKMTGGSAGGVSGGANIKHINITINKLVEQISVHQNNIKDSSSEIKRHIEEALLSAVNDVNYAN